MIQASWTFNQGHIKEEANGELRGARRQAPGRGPSPPRGTPARLVARLSPVSSSLSLKPSENHSQERHLRKRSGYFTSESNTKPQRASGWHWTGISAADQRSPGLRPEKLLSRYPAGRPSSAGLSALHPDAVPAAPAPASGRLHGQPVRTLERCSSDALGISRPCAHLLRPRARRRPHRGRQAGPSARVLSLTGPARAAGAHGSPRELGPLGLQDSARPWQAGQVAEPRSSDPAPGRSVQLLALPTG